MDRRLLLALTDAEHLGPADGTEPLRGRLAILHFYIFRVPDFYFFAAFHAISFHFAVFLPLLFISFAFAISMSVAVAIAVVAIVTGVVIFPIAAAMGI